MKNIQKRFSILFFCFLTIIFFNGCMSPMSRSSSPFGNSNVYELIIMIVIFFFIFGVFSRRRSGLHISGPTLVLKRFFIDDSPTSTLSVEIVGRASGLTAWLLTTMGLDAETQLSVQNSKIAFKSSSLFGEVHQIVPMASISSTYCGYSKPVGLLIYGIIIFVLGVLAGLVLGGVIIGGIFVIAYFLTKKISISIETSGGLQIGLSFKRSIIENVDVDIEKARKVIMIINNNILKQQEKV